MTSEAVDRSIESLPDPAQERLRRIRALIHERVPDIEERIAYDMPTFDLDGRPLLHVGGWKQHLGLYPVEIMDAELEARIAPYRSTPNALRFRHRDPLPEAEFSDLLDELVRRHAAG